MRIKPRSGEKVLIILPQRKFQDEEYSVLKNRLNEINIISETVIRKGNKALGMNGSAIRPDCLFADINLNDYRAVALIGGIGAIEHWHDKKIIGLIKKADRGNLLIGAICLAPVTLANAGILQNKKATCYESAASYLRFKGAIYTGNPVEVSENIITAKGPVAAEDFAENLIILLEDQIAKPARAGLSGP